MIDSTLSQPLGLPWPGHSLTDNGEFSGVEQDRVVPNRQTNSFSNHHTTDMQVEPCASSMRIVCGLLPKYHII